MDPRLRLRGARDEGYGQGPGRRSKGYTRTGAARAAADDTDHACRCADACTRRPRLDSDPRRRRPRGRRSHHSGPSRVRHRPREPGRGAHRRERGQAAAAVAGAARRPCARLRRRPARRACGDRRVHPHRDAPPRRRRRRLATQARAEHGERTVRQRGGGAGRRLALHARMPDDGDARRHAGAADHGRHHQRDYPRGSAAAPQPPRPRHHRDQLPGGHPAQDRAAFRGRGAARGGVRERSPGARGRDGAVRPASGHRVSARRRHPRLRRPDGGDRQERGGRSRGREAHPASHPRHTRERRKHRPRPAGRGQDPGTRLHRGGHRRR